MRAEDRGDSIAIRKANIVSEYLVRRFVTVISSCFKCLYRSDKQHSTEIMMNGGRIMFFVLFFFFTESVSVEDIISELASCFLKCYFLYAMAVCSLKMSSEYAIFANNFSFLSIMTVGLASLSAAISVLLTIFSSASLSIVSLHRNNDYGYIIVSGYFTTYLLEIGMTSIYGIGILLATLLMS